MVATTAKKKSHLINEAQKLNIFFVPFVNDLIMFLRVCSCLIKDVFLPNKIKNKGLLTLKKIQQMELQMFLVSYLKSKRRICSKIICFEFANCEIQ
jgi:hypothetical protein